MNKHTVTLNTAKKLKELGWEKDTLFYWVFDEYEKELILCVKDMPQINFDKIYIKLGTPSGAWYTNGFNDEHSNSVLEFYPTPTASELLEELPDYSQITKYMDGVGEKKYCVNIYASDVEDRFWNDNPAEALAKMWIYLKENKLI